LTAIVDRLPRLRRARAPALPPLDELVMTVLSQNTSDINSGRAYRRCASGYPRWQDVLEADRRAGGRASAGRAGQPEGAADPGDPGQLATRRPGSTWAGWPDWSQRRRSAT
jgi:hypothetical protein